MKKVFAILAAVGLFAAEAFLAAGPTLAVTPLKLAPIFSDNMVLQRNKKICIYGTGYGSGTITIGDRTKSIVSENGKWKVYFEPMKASLEPVNFSFFITIITYYPYATLNETKKARHNLIIAQTVD